jgi:hypothetical protein
MLEADMLGADITGAAEIDGATFAPPLQLLHAGRAGAIIVVTGAA